MSQKKPEKIAPPKEEMSQESWVKMLKGNTTMFSVHYRAWVRAQEKVGIKKPQLDLREADVRGVNFKGASLLGHVVAHVAWKAPVDLRGALFDSKQQAKDAKEAGAIVSFIPKIERGGGR